MANVALRISKMAISVLLFPKMVARRNYLEICENLRNLIRKKTGKNVSPSVGIIDSQSVKSGSYGGECRGFDGNKI